MKEVETLLVSIDELAKAIGKKIEAGGTLGSDGAHNGSLLAGAYKIATEITANLSKLKASEDLKEKITKAKECSEKFTDKLKSENVALGKQDASDDDAKKAILKTHNDITKGAKELKELSESVETLLKAAKEMLANSVKELTSPVVAETPKKP